MLVGRLIAQCFGGSGVAGCMCQFVSLLEPHWRKIADRDTEIGREIRCENMNPGDLLNMYIDNAMTSFTENAVNSVINSVNSVFNLFGLPGNDIGQFCMPNKYDIDRCINHYMGFNDHFADCEDALGRGGPDMMCYYARVHARTLSNTPALRRLTLFLSSRSSRSQVRTICMNPVDELEYQGLFAKGYENGDDLHKQFQAAFGDSFAHSDPTTLALIEQAEISLQSGPVLTERKDICSSAAFASALQLDEIVRYCPRTPPSYPLWLQR